MRPSSRFALILTSLAVFYLSGCAAENLIKKGDALLAANRAIEAEARYQEAQLEKPKLAEDPKFLAKFTRARCLAAYQRGVLLTQKGQWEQAVSEFEQSLRIGPEVADAPRALAEARGQAAGRRHQRALALADQGKLEDTSAELRRALELDAQNSDAQEALASLDGRQDGRLGQAETLFQQGLRQEATRDYARAAETLQQALAVTGNHLPSRSRLYAVNQRMAEARSLRSQGQRLLRERKLDESIAAYEKALGIWPAYEEAQREAAEPRRQRAVAQEHQDRAAALAAAGQWPEALRAAQAALGVYPHYAAAQALADQAGREAAMVRVRAGYDLLAAGKFEAAEVEFSRAMDFSANLLSAREGLAAVDCARGDAARRQGLWGNALLWYLDASDHVARTEYQALIAQARTAIAERVRFPLSIAPGVVPVAGEPSTAALVAQTVQSIAAAKPVMLDLVDPGAEVVAAFRVRLDLTRVDVSERRIDARNLAHHYLVRQEAANPEIGRLRHRLAELRRELLAMQADHRPCPTCRGSGRVVCPGCHGSGLLAGNRCPACGGPGRVNCLDCRGTGRLSRYSPRDLDAKRDEIEQEERRLRNEPPLVIVETGVDWLYTLETYEKVGKMVAAVQIIGPDGRIVHTDTVETQAESKDDTIRNANPAVGLPENPLDLPTDAELRAALLQSTAQESARRVIAAVVQQRINQAQERGQALSRADKRTEAVEAFVDAALLAEPLNAQESARVLKELRQR